MVQTLNLLDRRVFTEIEALSLELEAQLFQLLILTSPVLLVHLAQARGTRLYLLELERGSEIPRVDFQITVTLLLIDHPVQGEVLHQIHDFPHQRTRIKLLITSHLMIENYLFVLC